MKIDPKKAVLALVAVTLLQACASTQQAMDRGRYSPPTAERAYWPQFLAEQQPAQGSYANSWGDRGQYATPYRGTAPHRSRVQPFDGGREYRRWPANVGPDRRVPPGPTPGREWGVAHNGLEQAARYRTARRSLGADPYALDVPRRVYHMSRYGASQVYLREHALSESHGRGYYSATIPGRVQMREMDSESYLRTRSIEDGRGFPLVRLTRSVRTLRPGQPPPTIANSLRDPKGVSLASDRHAALLGTPLGTSPALLRASTRERAQPGNRRTSARDASRRWARSAQPVTIANYMRGDDEAAVAALRSSQAARGPREW